MLKNTLTTYGTLTKFFHWLMALLIVCMFVVAYTMINLPKSEIKFSLYNLHKATGVLIFGLVALRLLWRSINIEPTLPNIPHWQLLTARWNIIILYVLMILMPLSGFLMSIFGGHAVAFYNLFVIPSFIQNKPLSGFCAEAHEILSYLLIIAFVFHVIGAFYHHVILQDDTFKRMWIS